MNYRNITKLKDITKPCKMGDKLLILATAPSTGLFFEKESVRDHFKGYDIAFLNKMILCSPEETRLYKPKYFIFADDIFYKDDYDGVGLGNKRKEAVEEELEKIDWECYVITPVLGSFNVKNPNIKYIKLGVFSAGYKGLFKSLYRKNFFNTGFFTVVMAAIYYGITFGYEDIALLGFSYKWDRIYMDEDGLHLEGYNHYYDLNIYPTVIPFEEIFNGNESYLLRQEKRAVRARRILSDLAIYAKDRGTNIINYTPDNMVDAFRTKRLPE